MLNKEVMHTDLSDKIKDCPFVHVVLDVLVHVHLSLEEQCVREEIWVLK